VAVPIPSGDGEGGGGEVTARAAELVKLAELEGSGPVSSRSGPVLRPRTPHLSARSAARGGRCRLDSLSTLRVLVARSPDQWSGCSETRGHPHPETVFEQRVAWASGKIYDPC
jgi:hypothetical protein